MPRPHLGESRKLLRLPEPEEGPPCNPQGSLSGLVQAQDTSGVPLVHPSHAPGSGLARCGASQDLRVAHGGECQYILGASLVPRGNRGGIPMVHPWCPPSSGSVGCGASQDPHVAHAGEGRQRPVDVAPLELEDVEGRELVEARGERVPDGVHAQVPAMSPRAKKREKRSWFMSLVPQQRQKGEGLSWFMLRSLQYHQGQEEETKLVHGNIHTISLGFMLRPLPYQQGQKGRDEAYSCPSPWGLSKGARERPSWFAVASAGSHRHSHGEASPVASPFIAALHPRMASSRKSFASPSNF